MLQFFNLQGSFLKNNQVKHNIAKNTILDYTTN